MTERTFAHPSDLPRLPVPSLADTCAEFLRWVEPLLQAKELSETERLVAEFQAERGPGPLLQAHLMARAADPALPNWLEPFWDDMYRGYRGMLPIHMNFLMGLHPLPGLEGQSRSMIAAHVVHAALTFRQSIVRETLPPETEKGRPLCMMQLRRLFGTIRIPCAERDHLRTPAETQGPPATHIVVAAGGAFHRLEAARPDGSPLPVTSLASAFEAILSLPASLGETLPLGLLTTLPREDAARARKTLLAAHPANAASLETLERGLFLLCLDEHPPDEERVDVPLRDRLAAAFLHGDGRNRWFDKSLQIILTPEGRVGLNVEHTGLDGSVVLHLAQALFETPLENPGDESYRPESDPIPSPQTAPLTFERNEALEAWVARAAEGFDRLRQDTLCRVAVVAGFGKEAIKDLGMSPDVFVQVAMQVAYVRLTGALGSTYETAATRRFLHGRSETLRSSSAEALALGRALADPHTDDVPHFVATRHEALQDALQDAIAEQQRRMTACKAGQGVERHLLGLLKTWALAGQSLGLPECPALFNGVAWNRLRHDLLSTSNCGAPSVELFGFGPAVNDGFGIGYVIDPNELRFTCTARAALDGKLEDFIRCLRDAVSELRWVASFRI